MALAKKLRRLLKLGFFVGAGAAAALVAACDSSDDKKLDQGTLTDASAEAAAADTGAKDQATADSKVDAAAQEAGAADQAVPDKRGWDIPLE